ncbi:hypothetical protein [Enterococcus entomosocium]|uniref:hypothetical protein n=1 Tax=Enterococcus entomosocium TaxID=3034352 RepID=UPI0026485BBD|nr:hypothetical protein [Enterococcus entomosocium]
MKKSSALFFACAALLPFSLGFTTATAHAAVEQPVVTKAAVSSPSTWYYVAYRIFTGPPPSVVFESKQHPVYKNLYRGCLTYNPKGYAPGGYRVYEGNLYRSDLPYPGLARIAPDQILKQGVLE